MTKNFEKLIVDARNSTYLRLASKNLSIRVGTSKLTGQQITDNVLTALSQAIQKIPRGWKNILSLNLSIKEIPSLPFYVVPPEGSNVSISSTQQEEGMEEEEEEEGEENTLNPNQISQNDEDEEESDDSDFQIVIKSDEDSEENSIHDDDEVDDVIEDNKEDLESQSSSPKRKTPTQVNSNLLKKPRVSVEKSKDLPPIVPAQRSKNPTLQKNLAKKKRNSTNRSNNNKNNNSNKKKTKK